jgi:hypothetical protein
MRMKKTGTDIETGIGTVIATTGIATIEDGTHIEMSVVVLAPVTGVPHRLHVLCQQTSQFKLLRQKMKS